MVKWTDDGVVGCVKRFDWVKGDNGGWGEEVVEGNGKFYMYCGIDGNGMGVVVRESGYGGFKDGVGKGVVWEKEDWDDIEGRVLMDEDGEGYMYWGNGNCYYVKLNEEMI